MMTAMETNRLPPRLWPGIAAIAMQWFLWRAVPALWPDATFVGYIGGLGVCTLAVLLWWLFFSRAPWLDRLGAILLIALGMLATWRLLDRSVATGMMGMMYGFYAVPGLSIALVAGAAIGGRLSAGPRRAILAALILVACGFWALVRTNGMKGDGQAQLAWRWAKTSEQKLLARADPEPSAPPAAPVAMPVVEKSAPERPAPEKPASEKVAAPRMTTSPVPATPTPAARIAADWPGFRGAHRDSVVHGARIETNWSASPPVQLWRRAIGPGWSSFAVGGGLIYTQEQRGDFEVVGCYDASTGRPVWTHRDHTRFWESNGGAGPRGTPALHDGRVYSLGATGILNALDARDGAVLWTRDIGTDTATKIPDWGFAASPLIAGDRLIVAAAGQLAAYDLQTGAPRWMGPAGHGGYSSPQLVTLGGVEQVVLLSGTGATSLAPADGKLMWKDSWPGMPILQPAATGDGGLLITTSDMAGGAGTRRLAVKPSPDGWSVEELWTSNGLRPYFNDLVVHNGHAFGFDNSILSCIDLQDGRRIWKGGRYGHGQLLLLADQDVLLVVTEDGDLALVSATPDQFIELAHVPAIEGKTWNHPVLVGDLLLVRNGQEMAAFRLPRAGS